MDILLKIIQVILALSVLVLIHEFGHFFFAKIFHIRVDKFYLFFDAGNVRLFKFKPKNSDTEYGIGWLPLGGYCKIAGMIDESMDTDQMKKEPQPWEFRSHPAWQRFLVMFGGVFFNFIAAILIYIGILAGWGSSYFDNTDKAIYVNDLAYEMGFRTGDRILKYDDFVPDDFFMLQADLARENVARATVLRGADTVNIYIDRSMIRRVINTPGMFDLALPFVVDSIPPGSINYASGLMKGDRLVQIAGERTEYVQDCKAILAQHAGSTVEAVALRDGDTLVEAPVQIDSAGRIGVFLDYPKPSIKHYSLLSAIPAGFKLTFENISGYIKDMKLVFTPSTEAYKSVGSVIAITQVFPSRWNWYSFLNILALLSIMLGVVNLLPIPALDGGHMVFTLFEMLTGRRPSDNFMMVMQLIGMVLLIGLMILAFGNDIARLMGN